MSAPNNNPVPRPCACTTVRTASRTLARVFGMALSDSGLNVTQLAVLRSIERHPSEPLTRVAEALSMDRTSLYRAVGTMQRQGWVVIDTGEDARSKSARITRTGQKVLDSAAPHWERVQSDIVDRFGRARWKSLVAELNALIDVANELEPGAVVSHTDGEQA